MKGWSGWSPLKQKYKPPKQKHDTSKGPHSTTYNPEDKTIEWGGGTLGILSPEEIAKIERHETKHHHQSTVEGKDLRKRFFDDREKYIKENLKKHKIKDEDHELDLREDYASRFRKEQYETPGTTEYEAKQAEKKHSPGLMKSNKYV